METKERNAPIVAVFGVTGSGKSYFVQTAAQVQGIVGHTLRSTTKEITAYEVEFKGQKIIIVDTPGFDGATWTDTVVLRDLTAWLASTYHSGCKLSGLIYLHQIKETRMSGSLLRNLILLKRLVGEDALGKVVLTTTGWDSSSMEDDISRELQLKGRFWRQMIDKGAQTARFHGDERSALEIVSMAIEGHGVPLLIQKELVDEEKVLGRTTAGAGFVKELEHSKQASENELKQLQDKIRKAVDETLKVGPRKEMADVVEQMQRIEQQLASLMDRNESQNQRLEEEWNDRLRRTRLEDDWSPAGAGARNLYTPLDDTDFRLVRLRAAEKASVIEISLVIDRFDESRDFEAISYAWTENCPAATINVRIGTRLVEMEVSRTLEILLQHFRRRWEDRYLWIDALSINQNDVEERSLQVRRMGEIYASAKGICIWLGPAAENSDLGMDFVSQVLDFSKLDAMVLNPSLSLNWVALSNLMTREWFSRRWVVQEIAFAKEARVYCGAKSISWSEFASVASLFREKWPEIIQHLPPRLSYMVGDVHAPGAVSIVSLLGNIFRNGRATKERERMLSLESLLVTLPMYNVTNILDTVYAVLALARDAHDMNRIETNYASSETELFTKVLQASIESTGSLDMICRPWAPDVPLPSWIRTVSEYAFVRRKNGEYDRQNSDALLGVPGQKIYNATGPHFSRAEVRFITVPEGPRMLAKGIIVAKVEDVSPRCLNGIIPYEGFQLGGWQDRAQPVPPNFWRTLVLDRAANGSNPSAWYARACEYSFRLAATRDVSTSNLIQACDSSIVQDFLRRVQSSTWNKKFFVTESGSGWFGLGHAETQRGDLVCILFGCSVPVLLRQARNCCELVGECFVNGLMDGEGMKGLDTGTSPEEFCIR